MRVLSAIHVRLPVNPSLLSNPNGWRISSPSHIDGKSTLLVCLQLLILVDRSQAQRDRENGKAPDYTAVKEEAARRKAAKEREAMTVQTRLDREFELAGPW